MTLLKPIHSEFILSLVVRLLTFFLLLSPFLDSAFGIEEPFEVYSSTQSLGMGRATTADSFGYAALFHNPAGLAVFKKKNWELNIVDLEGAIGGGAIGRAVAEQTLGMYRFFGDLQNHPGTYAYFDAKTVPSFTMRNFGVALVGSHRFAGVSDGTTLDMRATQDVGIVAGYARQFVGNLLKAGITVKYLVRNEMYGNFLHSTLTQDDDSTFKRNFKEGQAIGADFGATLTFPSKLLPTIGLVWQDLLDTRFTSSHILNSQANGTPDKIDQRIHAAFSIHPLMGKGMKSTFSIEYKDFLKPKLPLRKHLHLGIEFETDRSIYVWLGASHFYPSFAVGYRVRGGNLEIGTYGEDIGIGDESKLDQRFFCRYTIGF